jgi:hypothetical protein
MLLRPAVRPAEERILAGTPDALIRQWFEDLWNRGDESTIDRFLAPNVRAHGLSAADQPLIGRDTFRGFYRQFRGMVMVRVANGQFVEGWNTFDFLTCYQQIELMPQLTAQA